MNLTHPIGRRVAVLQILVLVLLAACEAAPGPSSFAPATKPSSRPPDASSPASRAPTSVRHVAPDGDDANAGGEEDPWATLQHAADTVEPGTTVLVATGVYRGFTISRSGNDGAPTAFVAAPEAAPVIEEEGRMFLVHVDAASDIVLQGLEIRGATEQDGAGIFIGAGSARIAIDLVKLVDNRSFGVLIQDSQDVLVQGSDISGSASGIRTRGDVAGTEIASNDIHDNDQMVVSDPEPDNDTGGQGIAISLSFGPVTIRQNRIWGNRAESIDYGRDGSAIEIFGSTDVMISENVMWDNETVMETGTNRANECVNIRFVRNVAFADTSWGESKGILLRCARDSLVAHNTLVGIEEWVIQFRNRPDTGFSASIENLTVVNNVVSGDVAFLVMDPMPDSLTVDYNLVDADNGVLAEIDNEVVTTLAELRSLIGFQESGQHAKMHLADPEGRDFRLLPASPAVDAGLPLQGVNDDFASTAPDIGRYEMN